MSSHYQIVICSCPDKEVSEKLAQILVAKQLAACVNNLPNITSVYRWQDQVETAQEYLLLIKSMSSQYNLIELLIKENHPYKLPEIIAISIDNGSFEYLNWIASCHI